MRDLLIAICVFTLVLAGRAIACSICADKGWIETREQCKACNGSGKNVNTTTRSCTRCSGAGKQTYSKREGGRYQGTFCRACRGTGVNNTSSSLPCGECNGIGTKVSKVTCHNCKGASVLNGLEDTPAGGAASTPHKINVEACSLCDAKGNVSYKQSCEICDKGWNHEKTKQGTYVCRNCGAVCDTRFGQCKCGKPDCPTCKGEFEKKVTATCTSCGGDKIITPLEREKAKKTKEIK